MNATNINLEPVCHLLTKDINAEKLISIMDQIYTNYTDLAMKMSFSEGSPIDKENLTDIYYIDKLKKVFIEVKKGGENGNI